MKGFKSCLRDAEGKGLAESAEVAHILAQSYSKLCGDFIKQNRNRKRVSAVIGVLAFILFIVFVAMGPMAGWVIMLLIALGAGGFYYAAMQRKPKARVLALGKTYWVGSFEDFEDGQLLIDKSQLTESTSFVVPIPGIAPSELLAAAAKSEKLVASPPVMASRASSGETIGVDGEDTGNNDPIRTIQAQIAEVAEGLANYRTEQASLPVVPAGSSLTRAIISNLPSAADIEPKHSIVGIASREIDAKLKELDKLTRIVSEKTERSSNLEELTEQVVAGLEASVKKLDDIRRVSLIEVLSESLAHLEKALEAPMMLYYCPVCLANAAKEARIGLDKIYGMQIEDGDTMKELFQESADSSLAEMVEHFMITSRAAIMKLDITPNGEIWRCPQDHTRQINDEHVYRSYRAMQELVMPLWDQLWMELSSERAGLHERKDEKQRDNVQVEHRETLQAIEGFNAERREIRTRMDNLSSSTLRAVETFNELISSFIQSGLVAGREMAAEADEAKQFRQNYIGFLDDIDKKVSMIESELDKKLDESLTRHGPVMEIVDAVKVGSQFMEPTKPAAEQIIIEKL